jgi:predicted nucleic acid-binding protein
MLSAVIDTNVTNVLVSALISRHLGRNSASHRVYQALLDHRLILISSVTTLEELEEVLNREAIARLHQLTPDQVGEIVDKS